MELMEILSLVILAVGFGTVYAAKTIVKRFRLQEKQKCENASEMTEEEVETYKYNKAIFNVKITGLVVSIPGLVLFILSFRQ